MALIYIVEDDESIREIETIALKNSGHMVGAFGSSKEFFKKLDEILPDLVLLDVMLPDESGYDIIKKLRLNSATKRLPVIMVTAKSTELDMIKGLEDGADDYIKKPFSVMELITRVKALLRRSYYLNNNNSSEESDLINVGSLTIDKTRHRVVADGEEISLTAREFDILYLMASNKGRVFSSEEIFEKVWKEKYFQSNNTVMVHISRLRDKLDKHLNGEKIIHTVWGVGYKIEK